MLASRHPKTSRRFGEIALVAITIVFAAWLYLTDMWLPKGTSRVMSLFAHESFDQCFHTTGKPPDTFWRPSAALVREAEFGLAALLAARQRAGLTMPQESSSEQHFGFHHQYVGFVLGGERVLAINAYPFYQNESLNDEDTGLRERLVCVADGGRHFWRVIYHPASKKFSRFEFNGPA